MPGSSTPLRALWRHHRRHRPRVVAATLMTTLNTAADVAPELLLGVAAQLEAAAPWHHRRPPGW